MRSRTGRELAERALARLALELGDRVTSLTVIGGLNADLLTLPQEAAHQGTVDIDVLVEIGFVFDREEQDLGWVERGLVRAEERGARVYAEQRIRDGEDQDVETLVQDVVGAALACGAEFGRLITHSDDATGHHA